MSRQRSSSPGPTGGTGSGSGDGDVHLVSPAVRTAEQFAFSVAPHMTWDSFVRHFYDNANKALERQANLLLRRGYITHEEAKVLVDQRNRFVLEFRKPLSPFGKLYSEILKPSSSLKSIDQLIAEKGSIEAVLDSVGKTRRVVNRIGVVSRVAGPATIVLEVVFTAIVISETAPEERGRVAAREIGGTAGAAAGGIRGAALGCTIAAGTSLPALVVPIVGEIGVAGACVVGGLIGGLGLGWVGRKAGQVAGEGSYDIYQYVTNFRWVTP